MTVDNIHELSPVRRLGKGYSCQKTEGEHMVDLIDTANGNVLAKCIYERYADEIIYAVNAVLEHEKRVATLVEQTLVPEPIRRTRILQDAIEGLKGRGYTVEYVNLPGLYNVNGREITTMQMVHLWSQISVLPANALTVK